MSTITSYLKPMCVAAATIGFSSSAAYAQSIVTTTESGRTVTVSAINSNIVKVTNAAAGQKLAPNSIIVNAPAAEPGTTFKAGESQVLQTSGITVTLNDATGEVVINGGANKIVSDPGYYDVAENGEQSIRLFTTATGSYYGAGERGHKLNLRGDTLVMYNRQNYGYTKGDPRINQMNITMPLFISTDGFAIVFDDFAAAKMHLGKDSEITYTTESPDAISYYYVNGNKEISGVVEQLSALTGRQPLPPLWSLGYITSKYGYHNEKETLGAIDSLKTRGYPVDGIVLDLYWYGKEQDMGRLAWEKKQWPNPKKMLSSLKDQNVNLIAISQPYVLRNGKALDNYKTLSKEGMLLADSTGLNPQEVTIWVGEGGMLDVSNPKTQDWLKNKYRSLTEMGVTGWWGDLGEPEVHPESGLHANGLPARLYHNKYGNDWSKIVADMFAENYPDTRFVTMMRGGTTGLQQYSVFPWSTDVSRSWEGLQPQVTIMLNSGLSGMGYMGHDVGGFAVDPENPEDAELYVRWLQLGLFSPMLRTHAQYNAEPYHYEQYADIILPLIKERYRWLPYNYTLAYENAMYGYPLVRPLNFSESGASDYDDIDDEYLWGSEVLVAPVMQKGATSRKVTFPQGTWVDFSNPSQTYAGKTTIDYAAPLSKLPIFVRGGAFIPLADYKMESTADYNAARYTINYYPAAGVDSEYSLYDDNHISASSLANGEYRLINFKGRTSADGKKIRIDISSCGDYPGAPVPLNLKLIVHGIEKPASMGITQGSAKMDWNEGKCVMDIVFFPAEPTTLSVEY